MNDQRKPLFVTSEERAQIARKVREVLGAGPGISLSRAGDVTVVSATAVSGAAQQAGPPIIPMRVVSVNQDVDAQHPNRQRYTITACMVDQAGQATGEELTVYVRAINDDGTVFADNITFANYRPVFKAGDLIHVERAGGWIAGYWLCLELRWFFGPVAAEIVIVNASTLTVNRYNPITANYDLAETCYVRGTLTNGLLTSSPSWSDSEPLICVGQHIHMQWVNGPASTIAGWWMLPTLHQTGVIAP